MCWTDRCDHHNVCPFDHFRTACSILWHAALSLHRHHIKLPFFREFIWWKYGLPIKTESDDVLASWNVVTHAQKPDFVFRRKGRVHLNRREASVQSTTGSRGVRISGSNAGYTMFRGSVKDTGYPLHSPVSPSLPLPGVTVCHHISVGVYLSRDQVSSAIVAHQFIPRTVYGYLAIRWMEPVSCHYSGP